MKILKIFGLCLFFNSVFGQSDSDFPPNIIQAAGIDSCIILADFGNYPQKYYFDKMGRIQSVHKPTRYHGLNGETCDGWMIYNYYYRWDGLLNNIRIKAKFKHDSLNVDESLYQSFNYNLKGQRISDLKYGSWLHKITTYHYENEELVSEKTFDLFLDFKNLLSEKSSTLNKTSTTIYFKNIISTYGEDGEIKYCSISQVDSLNFTEIIRYYDLKDPSNSKEFSYFSNENWKIETILQKYSKSQKTIKIHRNKNGLVSKIESSLGKEWDFVFEYY